MTLTRVRSYVTLSVGATRRQSRLEMTTQNAWRHQHPCCHSDCPYFAGRTAEKASRGRRKTTKEGEVPSLGKGYLWSKCRYFRGNQTPSQYAPFQKQARSAQTFGHDSPKNSRQNSTVSGDLWPQRSFNGPFVYGGTNCTRGWNFVDIFFSDSVKIMRFYDFARTPVS